MHFPFRPLLTLLLIAGSAGAQTVKLPAEVRVQQGRLATVTVEYDGDEVKWTTPSQLDVFREYDPNPKVVRLRFIGYEQGIYHVHAVTCKGGKLSEFATCNIIVGLPGPGPVPPGPVPPDPIPPTPVPVTGLRVLIVYETSEINKMTAAQANVLYSKTISEYLNAKCPVGPDGKTKEWRIYDKDVDTARESKPWQDGMKRTRAEVPWIVIGNSKLGFDVAPLYEGPLPKDVPATIELLKKYGGA